jgi:heme-degrading monooxygenase HmoA
MTTASFAKLPPTPYYAVIFSSTRTVGEHADDSGYEYMANRMLALASTQAGYLGAESARGADGFGITVSYWDSLEAISVWRTHAEHRVAQETGKRVWYDHYELRIARVERAYAKSPATVPAQA